MGGIAINTEGRVLSAADGQPINGLFAIGEASGGVHGDNRLAGNSLLECTVFGRHVGLTLPIRKQVSLENTIHQQFSTNKEIQSKELERLPVPTLQEDVAKAPKV